MLILEKKPFQDEYEKIEVPKEEVLKAIKSGMKRADSIKTPNKNKNRLKAYALAASILLSSSFVFPSMSQVMAEVPMLGKLYVNFNDLVGGNLSSQQLITQLNVVATNKGIDIAITDAYYDGAVIGITFNVDGKVKAEQDGQLSGFYEIFDGKDGIADSKEIVYMESSEKGYSGHIQLNYPSTELPADATIPLEFKSIGQKEGTWKFDVPIRQLPSETIILDEERINVTAGVKVHFDSIIKGKASTAINYTATFPQEGQHDQVRLEIFDDNGKIIPLLSDGIDLETVQKNNEIIVKGRTTIPQVIHEQTSYIEIHPKVAVYEKDQFISLNEQIPMEIKSTRQNFTVRIEGFIFKEDQFTFDFQLNNGEKLNQDFLLFKNFAQNEVLLVKDSKKDVYEEPIKHSTKVLNEKELRFRSIFEIGKSNKEDYVVRVVFNTFTSNIPVELDSVKIDLN